MFCQETFDSWRSTLMTHVPHLSKTQATGLARWSLGMVLARSQPSEPQTAYTKGTQ
jgi:hypothetical protein